jgi:hypothetical protein
VTRAPTLNPEVPDMTTIASIGDGEVSERETLMLFGGLACMLFGAGLVLSNRTIRRYLGEVSPGTLLETAVPDVQRYMKLRAM